MTSSNSISRFSVQHLRERGKQEGDDMVLEARDFGRNSAVSVGQGNVCRSGLFTAVPDTRTVIIYIGRQGRFISLDLQYIICPDYGRYTA